MAGPSRTTGLAGSRGSPSTAEEHASELFGDDRVQRTDAMVRVTAIGRATSVSNAICGPPPGGSSRCRRPRRRSPTAPPIACCFSRVSGAKRGSRRSASRTPRDAPPGIPAIFSCSPPMIRSWCRIADWVFASPRNSTFLANPLNSVVRRAALRMSRRCASSRGKVWLRALQDGLAPDPVGAPLDRASRNQIHLSPDDSVSSSSIATWSGRLQSASGVTLTSRSRSLSGRKSSPSADPNTGSSTIFHLRQNSASRSVGMKISVRTPFSSHQFVTTRCGLINESSCERTARCRSC